MASQLITAQNICEGILKFILPEDTVIVDLEVMTLIGVLVYQKDKNCVGKKFFPWSEENIPPQEFLKKVKETQGQRTKDLAPNFQPKSLCKCPNFTKLASKYQAQLPSKHNAPNSDSSQDKHVITHDNIPVMVGKIQAQKWPRKQQTQRKINVRSNWSDSDNDKDSKARGRPIVYDITSDQETETDQQSIAAAPLT